MDVSFVIVTRNRFNKLVRLIDSLRVSLRGFAARHETIIIDDGSTDETSKLEGGQNLTVVHIEKSGPCVARNQGASLASGKYLAFLDDDAFLDHQSNYLSILCGHIKSGKYDLVGGAALSASTDTKVEKYLDEIGFLQQPCVDSKGDFACFPSVNILIKKEVFLTLGGFNERFTFPGGEDNHLVIRALRIGYSLYYDSEMYVRHENNISTYRFMRRFFNYGRGNAINQKLLGLSDEDCRFELTNIAEVPQLIRTIRSSFMSFKQPCASYLLLDSLRFLSYELGGIYQKVTQANE